MTDLVRNSIRRSWSRGLLLVVLVASQPVLPARAYDGSCGACSCNGDRDGDGRVTVDEVVASINNLLDACPPLHWEHGCGPPLHGGQDPCPESVNVCTTEQVGDSCDEASATCCTPDSKCQGERCNAPLVCLTHAPIHCPISRRQYKRDIEYLGQHDREELRDQLLAFKLAHYRYNSDSQSVAPHLGFIIEDVEPSPSVDSGSDAVNLYGYLSMAVATVQAQADDIETLKEEVNDLRQQLTDMKRSSSHRHAVQKHTQSPRPARGESR